LLVPVADELGREWASMPPSDAFVALGWQGMLRTLVAWEVVRRRDPARTALVARANLIGLSRDDLVPGTSPEDLVGLIDPRATLVVTEGDRGGLLSAPAASADERRSWRRYRAIPSDAAVDPTGAGDVLLAAMVATRLDPTGTGRSPGRGSGMRLAAAAASLAIEAPGLAGVPELDAVLRRMRRRSARIPSA
jgi:sugar/nucleoside kinase (ribokinase family)